MVASSDSSAPPPSRLGAVYSDTLPGHCVTDLLHSWPLVVHTRQNSRKNNRGRSIASDQRIIAFSWELFFTVLKASLALYRPILTVNQLVKRKTTLHVNKAKGVWSYPLCGTFPGRVFSILTLCQNLFRHSVQLEKNGLGTRLINFSPTH